MIKNISLLFLFLFGLGSISAQSFIGKINPNPSNSPLKLAPGDTVKILGVMVSFQEDKDGATFGNGKFGSIYTEDYGDSILDPLPHNRAYFEAHLEFVKNYYEKVSNGNLHIAYYILPDTFSVSQTMRNYTPPNNSDDFTSLADFSSEVWTKADSIYPNFDFSDYDLFTIFHAGVGRDVSLPGSIGDEKDLPSIYLGLNTLQNIYGPDFNGFPVSNNSFDISNSLIIPETESRELSSLGGQVLFQITINGLLTASVASYLGLPDLYDTETGLSAIGRFGLMDGQAIFGYNGIYPPEPSPWSKIYLGWAQPVTISPGNFNINLVTNLAANSADTVILKVPLNSSEYYLIENRNRDANNDGSILTYEVGGNTYTRTFTKDTTGYYSYSVDSVYGVVKDVDEYDWAVPGSGIVIWHIDENVIDQNIANNRINVDKTHRGVDVEEADGVQDIGEIFTTILGDQVVGEGSPEDLWYKSNPADLYKNKFSKDTRPNTNTNSGANSLITISNFSNIANKMSFNIAYGDSIIKPIFSKKVSLNGHAEYLTVLSNSTNNNFALLDSSNLNIFDSHGSFIGGINNFSKYKPAFVRVVNNYIAGANDSLLNVYVYNTSENFLGSLNIGHIITSPPLIAQNSSGQNEILVGTYDGFILKFSLGNLPALQPQLIDSMLIDSKLKITGISTNGDYYSVIGVLNSVSVPPVPTSETLYYDNQGNSFNFDNEEPVKIALTKDKNGNYVNIILTNKNKFYVIKGNEILSSWQAAASAQITSFGLTDLLQNGNNYIIYCEGNFIKAVNISGAEADNFPFEDPLDIGFIGTPLLADFEGNNNSEIISATRDGRIFAIDGGTGKIINGFPISSGVSLTSTPALYIDSSKISLAAVNSDNNFSAWHIGLTSGTEFWSEENGNSKNNPYIDAAAANNFISDFFPKDRAYNYPNPVYDNQTYIHYYVSESSKINIKIFDLAGDYVAELNDYAQGGLDHETTWNVSGIQSGIYLAHIEAESSSGKKQSNIIKIAVVK